jgi:hypothetical protein
VKKFREILSDMASWLQLNSSKITNFTVGSVARSLLEAIAIEVEELYYFIASKFVELQDGAIYTSFGFDRRPAIAATGTVTVSFIQNLSQSVVFPTGYKFYTVPINGKTIYFQSTQDVTASIGVTSVDIPVQCTEAGTVGNVPAYSIRRIVNSTPFLAGVQNNQRFFTGAPEETKEERQKRFNSFVSSLGKSSPDAVTYGCMQVSGIAGVYIQEDIGMIYVYAHDAYGNLDSTLKSALVSQLYNYKAGGIKAIVTGVTRKPVDLSIQVLINSGYNPDTVLYNIQDAVEVYLDKFTVSKSLVVADLIRAIMEIDREAIQNITLNLTSDIIVQPQELIRAGTITVTQMG